jgi:hypothetical protein
MAAQLGHWGTMVRSRRTDGGGSLNDQRGAMGLCSSHGWVYGAGEQPEAAVDGG